MIARLCDFYLGASSPYGKDRNKYYIQIGSRLFSPKWHQVIHLISVLLCSCHTPASVKRYHQGITTDAKTKQEIRAQLLKLPQESLLTKDANGVLTLLPLHENDSKLPRERLFYNRIAGDSHDNREILQYACDIACHWSFEYLQFSKEVI